METAFKTETIYHSLTWQKVVKETYGYKPFYYGYEGNSDVKIPSMLYKSVILRKKVLVSLPFSDEVSPLVKEEKNVEEVFTFYSDIFEKERLDYIEIKGLDLSIYETALRYGFREVNPNYRFILNLENPIDNIRKNFRKGIRLNIKKAQKFGVKIERNSENKISEFYRLHQLTMKRLGTPPHLRRFFENMANFLKDAVLFMNAKHNDECVASIIVLLDKLQAKARYAFSASHPREREINATSLLLLEAIKYSQNIGMRRFDFGVSRPESGVWYFKKGWCPEEPEKVLYMYKLRSGRIIDPRDSKIEKYTEYWKKIPLPVANLIGPWIRKQIGK